MRHNLIEAIVGAIVLAVAGFFFLSAYSSSQKNMPDGYTVYALFERIDGLTIGSDIKMSGVKIGIIHNVEINPKTYQAKVTMMLRRDIQIPEDSSAEVASESLLGGKYIALIPGGSEQFLKPNGEIIYTQSSISFEGLISKFLFSQSHDPKSDSKLETKPAT